MASLPTELSRLNTLEAENARLRAQLRAAGLDEAAAPPGVDRPLLQEESFTRLLIDSLSQGFYSIDCDGRTTLCNAAFLHMLGFESQSEVLGHRLHPMIHHTHLDGTPHPDTDCPIYRAAREGISTAVEDDLFFRKDGTSFRVEYNARPVYRDGQLQGAICTFMDITERLHAQRDLRESQEQLGLAVAAARIGIWDYLPDADELRWDDRVRHLFGLSPGRPITFDDNVAALHPDDRRPVQDAMAQALDPAGSGQYDVQFRTIGIEDGVERWVAATGHTRIALDGTRRFLGVLRDISEEKRSELHLRLMVNELNHRVKNSLAMVQAVAAQTFRSTADPATALAAFTERLVALARAHDVLTATNWESGDLRTIVDQTIETHLGQESDRVTIVGEPVALSPKSSLAFAIALHELATNALKYGALSGDAGTVAIRWHTIERGGRRLVFTWQEAGGPVVILPHRRGFGSKLIERGLASELQGEVTLEFLASGVRCTIDAPSPFRVSGSSKP